MNRNRLLIGLGLAVVLSFLLSAFVYRQFKEATAGSMPMGHVVVAAQALPLGARLDASKLRVISWPATDPMTGACARIVDCADRALITPVAENEPIIETKLAPRGAGAGLAAAIPEGMRAMSVAVNDVVGVAGFVGPGTMVDVLVTGTIPGASQSGQNITRTILENVRVLAAGQRFEQDRDGKPQTVPVITLLVNPSDAGKLAMASTEGKIQLALRNAVDTEAVAPAPVLQTTLFASGVPPAPSVPVPVKHNASPKTTPAPRPAPYVVEIISGSKRETKSFEDQ